MSTRMTGALALMAWCGCAFAGVGFDAPIQSAQGIKAFGFSTADVNGDGRRDIVLLRPDNGTLNFAVHYFPQAADGSFRSGRRLALGYSLGYGNGASYLFAQDLDRDGDPDFVAKVGSDFFIARNDRAELTVDKFGINDDQGDVHIIHANRDGAPDIVGTIREYWVARVIYTNGAAGFLRAALIQLADAVERLESGDVNGDGWPDLVYALGDGVYMNQQGASYFSSAPSRILAVDSGVAMPLLAVGDFNSDGRLDLALDPRAGSGTTIQVYFQGTDGSYSPSSPTLVTLPKGDLRALDMDGDGQLDLVSIQAELDTISIAQGRGDGSFDAAQAITIAGLERPQLVDMTGDGVVDVVDAPSAGGAVVYTGRRIAGDDLAVRLELAPNRAIVQIDNRGDASSIASTVALEVRFSNGNVVNGALPAGCTGGSGGGTVLVECAIPPLAAGGSDAFHIPVSYPPAGGVLTAEAVVAPSAGDLDADNNEALARIHVRALAPASGMARPRIRPTRKAPRPQPMR